MFAQQDAFGDSGYAGVAKAVRALPGDNPDIVRIGYKRNTVDVQDAVTQLRAFKGQIKAVVMVARIGRRRSSSKRRAISIPR